jgi:hypothetical protein
MKEKGAAEEVSDDLGPPGYLSPPGVRWRV